MFIEIQRTVSRIPKGKVATYGSVAEAAGFPGRARQVAWALRGADGRLPWHRVLGAGGRILLSGEAGIEQSIRLKAEGVAMRNGRVDLESCEFHFRARASRVKL